MPMRKGLAGICCTAVLMVGALGLRAAGAQMGQSGSTQGMAAKPMAAAAAAPTVRGLMQHQIADAQKKLIQLAEATPADKYGWRPAPGVRSTGEVFMHVASANYGLPPFWGATAPAGAPHDLEKMGGDKAQVVAALKDSFTYARAAIDAESDSDLGRPIKVFGHDATVGDAMMIIVSHAHEHLGQSIAYARVNGIVPPWSAPDAKGGH